MWTYHQTTGRLEQNATPKGICYSGHGPGYNNHAMEGTRGVGPIPVGRYKIGPMVEDHPHLGPHVMALVAVPGNTAHGRGGFFMHGDNSAMDHTASDGCIIANLQIRMGVGHSGDDDLDVVE